MSHTILAQSLVHVYWCRLTLLNNPISCVHNHVCQCVCVQLLGYNVNRGAVC